MKKVLDLIAAVTVAIAPLAAANAGHSIDAGLSRPSGTVAKLHAGFNWYGAQNDVYAYSGAGSNVFDSASVKAFAQVRTSNLDGVDFLALNSDVPNGGGGKVPGGKTVKAPEMDPASAAGALTLLFGGLLILGGRRARARRSNSPSKPRTSPRR